MKKSAFPEWKKLPWLIPSKIQVVEPVSENSQPLRDQKPTATSAAVRYRASLESELSLPEDWNRSPQCGQLIRHPCSSLLKTGNDLGVLGLHLEQRWMGSLAMNRRASVGQSTKLILRTAFEPMENNSPIRVA